MTHVLRVVGGLAVTVAVMAFTPVTALADPAGPTDYRTVVISMEPASDVIDVTVEGGDAFIRLAVQPGHEVIVLGYGSEPYIRVRADGVVEENQLSPATYYNEARYGAAVPADVTAATALRQAPDWEGVGDGGVWAWHDHRAHLMSAEPLIGMQPGDALPVETIEFLVDGETVRVDVVTTLQATPARWPIFVGGAMGIGVIAVLARSSRRIVSVGVAVVVAISCLMIGAAQYVSLSPQTQPSLTWWLLPVLALAVAVSAIPVRSMLWRSALVALAGLQLLAWGVPRRAVLTRAVLPTDLPFWLDRTVTAAALPVAAALMAVGFIGMFVPDGADR